MMVDASQRALANSGMIPAEIQSVRVVKGIWPYNDPGRLVARELGLDDGVTTAITGLGGNATYDLLNQTASEIAAGTLDAAIVCGAESMRTRRRDRSNGRRSTYLAEADSARPDLVVAPDVDMSDEVDTAAGADLPVNFYAIAESAIRHRAGEPVAEHLERIATLWAKGSAIASNNPAAWLQEPKTPSQIAAPGPDNRLVAAPYTKLLTSNINVDQGAAVVVCAYEVAVACGVPPDAMVFLASGSGAVDHLPIRARVDLDRSPAYRLSATTALALAQKHIDEIDHLDLYSCFPSSVQLAQAELDIDPSRAFTITGGLTFAGGPYNGYCTQTIAHVVQLLRGTVESAFLCGNGGFFSKHSVVVVSGEPPSVPFAYERPQRQVDALPARGITPATDTSGTLEGYTVTFDREGAPTAALVAVLDAGGVRIWGRVEDDIVIGEMLRTDQVGRAVTLHAVEGHPTPLVAFV